MRHTSILGLLLVIAVLAVPVRAATLTHYYSFASGATDSIGGADATLFGGATVTGGYLSLNGTDAYAQVGSHIIPTGGSYSVALWAQQFSGGQYVQEFVSQGASLLYGSNPGFYIGTTNNAGGPSTIRVTDEYQATGIPAPSDGAWHSYALSVDSVAGTSMFYVDGALADTFSGAIATGVGGTDTRFGAQFDPFGEFLNGNLDEIRVYRGALSSTDVASITAPVPEPKTYAMLLAGLGLMGFVLRHRKQPTACT